MEFQTPTGVAVYRRPCRGSYHTHDTDPVVTPPAIDQDPFGASSSRHFGSNAGLSRHAVSLSLRFGTMPNAGVGGFASLCVAVASQPLFGAAFAAMGGWVGDQPPPTCCPLPCGRQTLRSLMAGGHNSALTQ